MSEEEPNLEEAPSYRAICPRGYICAYYLCGVLGEDIKIIQEDCQRTNKVHCPVVSGLKINESRKE